MSTLTRTKREPVVNVYLVLYCYSMCSYYQQLQMYVYIEASHIQSARLYHSAISSICSLYVLDNGVDRLKDSSYYYIVSKANDK